MTGRFHGRVALITGASRGIGFAVAERFVAEGGRVCITGRDEDALADAVGRLGGPDRAMASAGSAENIDHQRETVDAVTSQWERLDVLVNNTGMNPAFGPALETSPAAFTKIMAINVGAAISWVAQTQRGSRGLHDGAIVNVASVAGLRPARGIGVYGASKAALMHLTQQLASELAPRIRVNAVAPAIVRTRFASPLFEGQEHQVSAGYPLGRIGTPEDVAAAAAFLASDDASWVTGQVVTLDGGLTLNGGV